jgi:dihydroneopterin aldolase
MGRIALEGMEFYGHHGYYVEERKKGKTYVVDICAEVPIQKSGASDHLEDTVNYEIFYQICREEMDRPRHLIEKVAGEIAKRIHQQFPGIDSLEVKVKKLSPDLGGPVQNAHVIFRIPEDL